MKTEFWLMAGVLIVIGLLIVIPPLWRRRESKASDVDQQNIDIARQKLSDLKSQLANGVIDQGLYEAEFAELEQALSDDLSLSRNPGIPQKQGRWIVGLLVVIIPVVAVSLYLTLGNPNALFMTKAPQIAAKKSAKQQIDSVEGMVSGLAERLKNQPDDLQGWVMLGKSYKYLKQFKKAADAFAKANVLAGSDPDVMLQYADALVMVNKGSFAGEPRQLILKALELAPDNATGLWLAGMIKAQEGEYSSAMGLWRRLEVILEPGSKPYNELKTLMANVQAQIDAGGTKPASSLASGFSDTEAESLEAKIAGLVAGLKDNPDDLKAWAELGISYKRMKQYENALAAFEKANVMSGKQADVMLMYADALVMNNGGQYSDQAKTLIFRALELTPEDTTGLWLAGKARVQEGKYTEALLYLRRAETQLQPDSESYKILHDYIANVESQLTSSTPASVAVAAAAATAQTNKTQQSGEAGLQVKVGLSAELQNQTAADNTVFIYAKAMSGPQMPLAIVRKKVSDLPVIVRLTDAQAMTPMMKLSKFQQVKLTARISKTGNAMQQPGDMIGVIDGVSVAGQEMITINIDRVIN